MTQEEHQPSTRPVRLLRMWTLRDERCLEPPERKQGPMYALSYPTREDVAVIGEQNVVSLVCGRIAEKLIP